MGGTKVQGKLETRAHVHTRVTTVLLCARACACVSICLRTIAHVHMCTMELRWILDL